MMCSKGKTNQFFISNSRVNLAYFYEDILLIFMNIKFYKIIIEQRKTNDIYGVIFKHRVGMGTLGDKICIEILNN